MKIRTQSVILIAGIVAMPLLVISLFIAIERQSFAERESSFYRTFERLSSTGGPENIVRYLFEGKPESVQIAIADPAGRVLRSDIDGVAAGSDLAASLVAASRRLGRDRILAFGPGPPMPPGYAAVVSMPSTDFLPKGLRSDIIMAGIAVLAAILAFTAAMCVLIVRSITKSVLSLEAATKRVAAGDLDVPIDVDGSNEIASLSRSLDRLRVEIREDQARRARFIMGISHDLRTPLALVKGYAEALEEELSAAEPSASAHLGIILSKADQLEGMIDDLIDFERVDTGEWNRDLAEADLGAFLRSFAKRVGADAALLGREIRSSINLPPDAKVRMDERLATRALENLVNNALRYTSPGNTISIEASEEGEAYVLVIADDGPGISPEDLPHIFEPFYRGSSSRREQGMGLGLSIVKTIVDSHGWKITATSGRAVGGSRRGAVFALTMPRAGSAGA